MGNTGEMKGFIFAVTFILLFSSLVATMPTGFTGLGQSGNDVSPVNPNLVTDFAESENWTKSDYILLITSYFYDYDDLGGLDWRTFYIGSTFEFLVKDKFLGMVWLGALLSCDLINENGTDYGTQITLEDFENDQEDGIASYDMRIASSGKDGGTLIIAYNTTTYDNTTHAFDNDELYFTHGMGITADTNVVNLLLALLFLQVPELPVLLNLLLVIPVWACVIYLIWFFITSMIPFLGS